MYTVQQRKRWSMNEPFGEWSSLDSWDDEVEAERYAQRCRSEARDYYRPEDAEFYEQYRVIEE